MSTSVPYLWHHWNVDSQRQASRDCAFRVSRCVYGWRRFQEHALDHFTIAVRHVAELLRRSLRPPPGARRLHALGPRWVLLKGGHLEGAAAGGVVPYGGGGGGPRRVGTVRDWAQGFFVAGSTLDDLNGVYALVDPNSLRRACRTRRCKVAYRNEESDWILAFAGPPVGLKTKSGKCSLLGAGG